MAAAEEEGRPEWLVYGLAARGTMEAQQYDPAIRPIFFQTLALPLVFGGSPDDPVVAASLEKLGAMLGVTSGGGVPRWRLPQLRRHLPRSLHALRDQAHPSWGRALRGEAAHEGVVGEVSGTAGVQKGGRRHGAVAELTRA
ncbi:hypothetical protein ZIOFF_034056 [Zingiber officinale]|uniref:Uncharacterized protein n=1 Tax=Zingiber officinale TaxID=94328 RepID=A0A8J5GJ24_ZINOF|nr:hypothetical protein ZIOFF_034056 [Zingiber officinale]